MNGNSPQDATNSDKTIQNKEGKINTLAKLYHTMSCRKNVSFDGRVRIRSVPSLDDFSREELNATWLSIQDINHIKSRERRLRSDHDSLQDELRTELGLESKAERRIRRSRMDIGKYSVLLEQQRQWEDETNDPETLARAVSATSQESMNDALRRATSLATQLHDRVDHAAVDPKNPRLSSGRRARRGRRLLGHSRPGIDVEPFSKLTSSNQKWHVASADSGLSLPRRTRNKYDLSRLSGLVAVQTPR